MKRCLVAAGLVLKPGYDWFFPYYRDRALALTLGVTPYEYCLQAVGPKDDPVLRRPPDAFALGNPKLNIVAGASPTGPAMAARGGRRGSFALLPEISEGARTGAARLRSATQPNTIADEVMYVSGGEGSTSEGEFFESLNAACLRQLPVLFLVEDNGYAISVPVEVQTAGGSISKLVANYPASARARSATARIPWKATPFSSRAVEHCRRAQGTGAGARARDSSLFAFAFRRRKALQNSRRARSGSAPRSDSEIWAVFWCAKAFWMKAEMEALEARGRPRNRRSH